MACQHFRLPRVSTCWTWSQELAIQTDMWTVLPKPFSVRSCDIKTINGHWEIWSPNSSMLASYPGVRPRNMKPDNFHGYRLYDGSMGRYDPGFVPQVLTDDTAYFAFVTRYKGTRDLLHYPEWCPIASYWRPIKEPDIGRPWKKFIHYLIQRCEHLENIRLEQIEAFGRLSLHEQYNSQPTVFSVQLLDRELRWDEAVDAFAALQLAMKLKLAFYHYYSALNNVGGSYTAKTLRTLIKNGTPTINNPPRFMGGWVNGVSQTTLEFLLASGTPCFIVHEYSPLPDDGTDKSSEINLMNDIFFVGPETEFSRNANPFDILGEKQQLCYNFDFHWPVPIAEPANYPSKSGSLQQVEEQIRDRLSSRSPTPEINYDVADTNYTGSKPNEIVTYNSEAIPALSFQTRDLDTRHAYEGDNVSHIVEDNSRYICNQSNEKYRVEKKLDGSSFDVWASPSDEASFFISSKPNYNNIPENQAREYYPWRKPFYRRWIGRTDLQHDYERFKRKSYLDGEWHRDGFSSYHTPRNVGFGRGFRRYNEGPSRRGSRGRGGRWRGSSRGGKFRNRGHFSGPSKYSEVNVDNSWYYLPTD